MEKIFQDQNHDAGMIYRARHRKGLTRACSAIGKDTRIVALDDRWDQLSASTSIHVLRRHILIKDAIKEITLLTTTMQDIWLSVLLYALHVDLVKYKNQLVLGLHDSEVLTFNFFLR